MAHYTKNKTPCPDWFSNADYEVTKEFCEYSWSSLFFQRLEILEHYENGEIERASKILINLIDAGIKEDIYDPNTLEKSYVSRYKWIEFFGDMRASYISNKVSETKTYLSTMDQYDSNDLDLSLFYENFDNTADKYKAREILLVVDLFGPTEFILDNFKRVLDDARIERGIPSSKSITENTVKHMFNNRWLQLIDLYLWKVIEEPRISLDSIYSWTFDSVLDPVSANRKGKAQLKRALEHLKNFDYLFGLEYKGQLKGQEN